MKAFQERKRDREAAIARANEVEEAAVKAANKAIADAKHARALAHAKAEAAFEAENDRAMDACADELHKALAPLVSSFMREPAREASRKILGVYQERNARVVKLCGGPIEGRSLTMAFVSQLAEDHPRLVAGLGPNQGWPDHLSAAETRAQRALETSDLPGLHGALLDLETALGKILRELPDLKPTPKLTALFAMRCTSLYTWQASRRIEALHERLRAEAAA